jgi:5-formyltetrahydrofolate cyclo-ligase
VKFVSDLFNIVKSGQKFGNRSNTVARNVKKQIKNRMNKIKLRKVALAARNNLTQDQIQTWSQDICNKIIRSQQFQNAKIIHIYKSFGSEVQTQQIIDQAFINQKIVVLPEILNDKTMQHWQISSNTIYRNDDFGIEIPVENCKVFDETKLTSNDLILIPLVGFDSHNNRIGYGMGHYDRFLQNTKAKKIGLAFKCQQVKNFEADPWDISLDQIIQN